MDRLSEIRARCDAATPGPWDIGGIRKNLIQTANAPFCEVCTVRGGSSFQEIDGQQKSNAAFIAHAREDIPYLLSEIERLKQANKISEDAWDGCALDAAEAQIAVLTARAEKAEAERDTYRAALEALHINVDLLKGE